MKFKMKEVSGVTVITPEAAILGGPDATELNDTLRELANAKKKKVVVDLGGVSLVNSSGLGTLIGGLTSMRNAGGDLKLANLSKKIRELLTVTRLISVFEVYESVKDAVASFRRH